jgi:REJ domain
MSVLQQDGVTIQATVMYDKAPSLEVDVFVRKIMPGNTTEDVLNVTAKKTEPFSNVDDAYALLFPPKDVSGDKEVVLVAFRLPSMSLEPGLSYVVQFVAHWKYHGNTMSEYSNNMTLHCGGVPDSGVVSVWPLVGVAGLTEFTVVTSDWVDTTSSDNSTLLYTFKTVLSDGSVLQYGSGYQSSPVFRSVLSVPSSTSVGVVVVARNVAGAIATCGPVWVNITTPTASDVMTSLNVTVDSNTTAMAALASGQEAVRNRLRALLSSNANATMTSMNRTQLKQAAEDVVDVGTRAGSQFAALDCVLWECGSGRCVVVNGSARCDCAGSGYVGSHCHVAVNGSDVTEPPSSLCPSMNAIECSGHGQCRSVDCRGLGSSSSPPCRRSCVCDVGYGGMTCGLPTSVVVDRANVTSSALSQLQRIINNPLSSGVVNDTSTVNALATAVSTLSNFAMTPGSAQTALSVVRSLSNATMGGGFTGLSTVAASSLLQSVSVLSSSVNATKLEYSTIKDTVSSIVSAATSGASLGDPPIVLSTSSVTTVSLVTLPSALDDSIGSLKSQSNVGMTVPGDAFGLTTSNIKVALSVWSSSPFSSAELAEPLLSSVLDVHFTVQSGGRRLLNDTVSGLTTPITIWHSVLLSEVDVNTACKYWEDSRNEWTMNGLVLVGVVGGNHTSEDGRVEIGCATTHMSTFAVTSNRLGVALQINTVKLPSDSTELVVGSSSIVCDCCLTTSTFLFYFMMQTALSTRNLASVITLGLSFSAFLLWIVVAAKGRNDAEKWRKLIFRKRGSFENDRQLSDACKTVICVLCITWCGFDYLELIYRLCRFGNGWESQAAGQYFVNGNRWHVSSFVPR